MTAFFVPGVPATKGSWRPIRGKRGKTVLLPDNAREKPWALAVAWSAKAARMRPLDGAVKVTIHCWFPRPKNPTNPFPARNDVDKLARSTLDALTGIAWQDDQQVVRLVVTKAYVDVGAPEPGAWIEIARLGT